MKDPYAVLGVDRNADLDTIKRAFHIKAKETHPDLNKDNPNAAAEFRDVVDAYAILSNEQSRREYDASVDTGADYNAPEQATEETEEEYYDPAEQEDYQSYYYRMYAQLADLASDAIGKLFSGFVCIVIGVCFSLGGYLYASIHGGTYTMWYGIAVIGVLSSITGFYRYLKIRKAMKEFEKNML